jgi:hypothetical protein
VGPGIAEADPSCDEAPSLATPLFLRGLFLAAGAAPSPAQLLARDRRAIPLVIGGVLGELDTADD